jgi:hypothetical protein
MVTLGATPPAIGTTVFSGIGGTSSAPGTIIVKVPDVAAYQSATITTEKTWNDVTNKPNAAAGYFWNNSAATRDYLTVNLTAING